MFLKNFRSFSLACAILLFGALAPLSRAAGVVSSCDEGHLRTALTGGGLVTFSGDCTITLAATLSIPVNTAIDGGGHNVVLDGGGSVQVLSVAQG